MPFTVQRWPGSAVLVVTGHGAGSLDESERVLEELARQQLVPVLHGVLFDLRQLEWIPNPEEARLIAARYGTFGARHGCRMAYLAPPGAQYAEPVGRGSKAEPKPLLRLGVGVYHIYGDETTFGEGYNMQQVPKEEQGLFGRSPAAQEAGIDGLADAERRDQHDAADAGARCRSAGQCDRSATVDRVELASPALAQQPGGVDDGIDAVEQRRPVGSIVRGRQFEPAPVLHGMAGRWRATAAGAGDGVAGGDQRRSQMPAEEAAGADQQDMHRASSKPDSSKLFM